MVEHISGAYRIGSLFPWNYFDSVILYNNIFHFLPQRYLIFNISQQKFTKKCLIKVIKNCFIINIYNYICCMKTIPQFPSYSIDEAGTTILKQGKEKPLKVRDQIIKGKVTGYKYATLCSEGYFWKGVAIHRLVALTYIPNPNNLPEVNHIDKDKANNHISNLEWCTHQQNIVHSYLTRTPVKGQDHWNFGKEFSKETKQKMSSTKIGANHPKFKGYYIVHHQKYESAPLAAKATGEVGVTIIRKCKKGAQHSEYYFVPVP